MLQQQLLCLIYTVYYKLYSLGITGKQYAVVVHDIYRMTSLLSFSNILLSINFVYLF